jgi:hypothetical protein
VGYRLKAHRPIGADVRRIAGQQLALALEQLHAVGTARRDEGLHEARRHVKKLRALLRLVRPVLGDAGAGANRRLARVSRMLAPIADARAIIGTLAGAPPVAGIDDGPEGPPTRAALHAALVARTGRIDRKGEVDRIVPKARRLLLMERTRIDGWTLDATGIRAIAPGLEDSVRRTRKTMKRALERPTAANYHAWRQRVKDVWFHTRLINGRCGAGLAAECGRLEALDGCLGEYHNVLVLEAILHGERIVGRGDTMRGLRLLRAYKLSLRRQAERLAAQALRDTPRQFVRRVQRLWGQGVSGAGSKSRGSARPRVDRRADRPARRPRRRAAARFAARSSAERKSAPEAARRPAPVKTSPRTG